MKPVVIAYFNEYGYRINCVENDNHIELYWAGNNPHDSHQQTSPDQGLPLSTIKRFSEQTGREIADEHCVRFAGSEYDDPPEAA